MPNRDSEPKGIFCPICGAYQPKDSRFCGSCGAALQTGDSIFPEESVPEKTETETEKEYTFEFTPSTEPTHRVSSIDAPRRERFSETSQRTSFGGDTREERGYRSSTSSYGHQHYRYPPPRHHSKENANIALVLGIIGFFVNCCIIPFIGLHFVKKAEENNEDPSTISAARIMIYIQLCFMVLNFIFLMIFFMAGLTY